MTQVLLFATDNQNKVKLSSRLVWTLSLNQMQIWTTRHTLTKRGRLLKLMLS